MKPELKVHIGFPKTGTTMLQQHVFPNLKKSQFVSYEKAKWIFRDLMFADESVYDRNELESQLTSIWDGESETLVVSLENLVGYQYHPTAFNRTRNLTRLNALSFNTSVLVTLRDRDELIDSVYRQYVQKGGTESPSTLFVSDFQYISHSKIHLSFFDMDSLVALSREIFGSERVSEISFELLRKDRDAFKNELEAFFGEHFDLKDLAGNKSVCDSSLKLLRYMNRFSDNFFRPLSGGFVLKGDKTRFFIQQKVDPVFRALGGTKRNILSGDAILKAKVQSFFKEESA